mmetsp:Transcript_13428/g.49927  ORF Transcript_13428/g.49927 Transcript_13428/m.49927 type:complete len:229 (-) Transcript_13428:1086-1772(-)
MQEQAQLVRIALDFVLSGLGLEVLHQLQELLLLREEERAEGLLLGKLVPLVLPLVVVLRVVVGQRRGVRRQHVHVPRIVLELLHLVHIPLEGFLDPRVDHFVAVRQSSAEVEADLLLVVLAPIIPIVHRSLVWIPAILVMIVCALHEEEALVDLDPLVLLRHRGDLVRLELVRGGAILHGPRLLVARALLLQGHQVELGIAILDCDLVEIQRDGLLEDVVPLIPAVHF